MLFELTWRALPDFSAVSSYLVTLAIGDSSLADVERRDFVTGLVRRRRSTSEGEKVE